MKNFFYCRNALLFFTLIILLAHNVAQSKSIQITAVVSLTDTGIVKAGATPRLVSRQFSFTEGPAVDKGGNIFFTDQPNNKIWKYDTEGKLSVFMDNAGRSNGMYFDGKGNLITCADEHNQLWSIAPDKKVTVLLKDFRGHLLNGPNDLWINSNGNIYFTDPYYQRNYWERKKPDAAIGGQWLYGITGTQTVPVIMDSMLKQPNGIVGTPDGKYLYVADMGINKTFRYDILQDGSLSGKQVFAEQASDGMTLDEQGNIYLTGQGVTVYNNKAQKIAQINIPEKWTANICFGGTGRNILFITASEAIYTVEMNVKGVE